MVVIATPTGPISSIKPGQVTTPYNNEAEISSNTIPTPDRANPPKSNDNFNYENTAYYGQTIPPKQTVREVIEQNSAKTIPYSPPITTSKSFREEASPSSSLANEVVVKTSIDPITDYIKKIEAKGGTKVNIYEKTGIDTFGNPTGPKIGTVNADQSGIDFINSTLAGKEIYLQEPIKNADKFYPSTVETISSLEKAKQAGITNLDIYDKFGNKIGSTNPQNVTRARYDIIKASAKSGGEVTGRYTQTISNTETTYSRLVPTYKEDIASLIARPILNFASSITSPIIEAFKTGKIQPSPGLSLFEGNIGLSPEVSQTLEKTYGLSEEVQKVTTGQYTGLQTIAALTGIATSVAIPLVIGSKGLGIKNPLATKISYIKAQINAGKVIKAYQTSEQNLVTNPIEKAGNIITLSKGTAGKSGIITFTPEESNALFINKLPNGKIEVIKPISLIPQTKEVTGIGKIGEVTIAHEASLKELADRYPLFGQGHNNDLSDLTKSEPIKPIPKTEQKPIFGRVTLIEPNEVTLTTPEGRSLTPFGTIDINPENPLVTIIRSEPQNELPFQKVQLTFEGTSPLEAAGLAVHYGGTPIPGMKNTFEILMSGHNVQKLAEGLESKVVTQGTDIFKLGLTEFSKNPELNLSIIKNPEILNDIILSYGVTKPSFESIIRPQITRTMIGRGFSHLKTSKVSTRKNKPQKPFTLSDLSSMGEKVGAGAAGKANQLLEQTKPTFEKIITSQKSSSSLLSKTPSKLIPGMEEMVFESLVMPPSESKSSESKLSGLVGKTISSKTELLNESGLLNVSKSASDLLNKSKSIQNVKSKERTSDLIDMLLNTSQTQETTQATKLIQKTSQETIQDLITGKPTGKPGKPPIVPPLFLKEEKKKNKSKKVKGKEGIEFIGNASENTVIGLFNRSETTYGEEKVSKLLHKDTKITITHHNKLVKTIHTSLVSKNKPSLNNKEPKKKGNVLNQTKNILFGKKGKKIKF